MIGIGITLNKHKKTLSDLKLLTRSSKWAICGDIATETSKGTNNPQTNPIIDLVGKTGKNLCDTVGMVSGFYIDHIDGVIKVSASQYYTPSYFKVIENTIYSFSNDFQRNAVHYARIVFYDSNKTFISGVASPPEVKSFACLTPSNCEFVRISCGTSPSLYPQDKWQLEKNEIATTYELFGKINGYLKNFAFTTSSGYVDIIAPNGKNVTGIQCDGTNDVILLPNNAPNPTNENFAFGFVIKTNTNKVKYILTRNDSTDLTTQYAFKFDANGNLFVILEGVAIQIGTTLSVGFHSIWLERESGTLKAFIDRVETYNDAHVTTLTSRANTVMIASTTGTGTYTGFSNDILLASKYCDFNIVTNRLNWFKFVDKFYGL